MSAAGVGLATTLAVGLSGCGNDEPEVIPPEAEIPDVPPTDVPEPTPTQDVIASPIASYQDPTKWAGRTLTVALQGGGPYQRAQREAYYTPFEQATGARIVDEIATIGDLRTQVAAGEVVWDVVNLPTEDVLPLSRERMLEQINYVVVDRSTLFTEYYIDMQHAVASDFFSTGIVYPTESGSAPESWTEFWDTSRFGGSRTMRRSPVGTLEFALLADGVELDELYPLDVRRAFESLERIFHQVSFWYQDGQQPVQMVVGDQVGLASGWNVRVEAPDIAGRAGFQWNGAMLSANSWVIPRGGRNVDVAMDFINYATRAVPNANFCRLVPFGPVNRGALELLRTDRLEIMPTADQWREGQFVENWNYWADNLDALTDRFEMWLAKDRVAPPATPEATPISDE